MSNQVLIVAAEAASRTPASVAQSLNFTPVIAANEEEALALLDEQVFSLIAVGDEATWQRMREIVESRQPMTRVLRLPEANGDDTIVRRLLTRYLEPPPITSAEPRFSEKRYQFLSHVLEAFTGPLDLEEAVRRIVTLTREEFAAARGWLIRAVTEETDVAKVAFAVAAPGLPELDDRTVSLTHSHNLIRRAIESPRPITVDDGDPDLDSELVTRYQMITQLMLIIRPREGEPWMLGLTQSSPRKWSEEEIELFSEIGRYATLALNNTLLHARAVREMAKVSAILNQIPESAAIYDADGRLERMNAAASKEPASLFSADHEGRMRGGPHRYVDGSPL